VASAHYHHQITALEVHNIGAWFSAEKPSNIRSAAVSIGPFTESDWKKYVAAKELHPALA